jgi:hypothetical protein
MRNISQKTIILFLSAYPLIYPFPGIGQYNPQLREYPASEESLASQSGYGAWPSFESKYCTIYLEPGVDARRVQRRLNQRSFYTYAAARPDRSASDEEKIAYRIDILLEKAKEILGIYPSKMDLKIKIFKTRQELDDEFTRIVKRVEDVRSFYVHQQETIYLSEPDISDSIVAHEMGHAVVDHYFQVVPPAKLGEMLAQYVDLHLED